MKPTVISGGGGSNNNSNNPQNNAQNQGFTQDQGQQYQQANPQGHQEHQSQYPQQRNPQHFQSFGFDSDMDDMFPEGTLRSRLGRIRDPFSSFTGHNVDDFFGNLGRRNRPQPQTDIFTDFPDDFRQYIPEGFGFTSRGRAPQSPRGAATSSPRAHPQEHYQTFVQPDVQQVPQSPKPNLCDAAIQTEDDFSGREPTKPQAKTNSGPNINQQGAQIPQREEQTSPRSYSDPNVPNNNCPPHMEHEVDQPIYVSKATFSPNKSQPNRAQKMHPVGSPPNPPPRSQIPNQHRPPPFHLHQQTSTEHHVPTTPGGSYIRTVPIFVEGRSEPIVNAHKHIPGQTTNQQESPYQQQQNYPSQQHYPQEFQPNQQQQQQQQQQQHSQQNQQSQHRPTPLNTQDITTQSPIPGQVPQTPHTTECIQKITDIQRDVLELMTRVEEFKGLKNDKDFGYLDEMLTRNLLKLDTIDTNGKESIRLARKEAIRCIQASINVLEAKAGANAIANKTKHELNEVESNNENSDNEPKKKTEEENPLTLSKSTIIALPPPESHDEAVENVIAMEDQKSANEEKMEENQEKHEETGLKVVSEIKEDIPAQNTEEFKAAESENTEHENSKMEIETQCVKSGNEHSENNNEELDDNQSAVKAARERSKSRSPAKELAKKKIIKKLKKVTKKEEEDNDKKKEGETENSEETKVEN